MLPLNCFKVLKTAKIIHLYNRNTVLLQRYGYHYKLIVLKKQNPKNIFLNKFSNKLILLHYGIFVRKYNKLQDKRHCC